MKDSYTMIHTALAGVLALGTMAAAQQAWAESGPGAQGPGPRIRENGADL